MSKNNGQKDKDTQKPVTVLPGKTWLQRLFRLGLLFVLLMVPLGVAGVVFNNSLIFYPDPTYRGEPNQFQADHETVWLTTDSGKTLKAWYIPAADNPAAKTLLVFQGNSGNMSMMLDRLAVFHSMGLNTMIVDYPGFGHSSGSPTEEGTYQAAEEAWQWVVKNKSAPEDIAIYGFSLGGGVASWLAAKHTPSVLILDSTFTRLSAVPSHVLPLLKPYFHLALGDAFDTQSRLAHIKSPILVHHSPEDKIVPFVLGEQLYQTYQNNSKYWAEGTGGHMDFVYSYYDKDKKDYRKYLNELLLETTEN